MMPALQDLDRVVPKDYFITRFQKDLGDIYRPLSSIGDQVDTANHHECVRMVNVLYGIAKMAIVIAEAADGRAKRLEARS